MNASDLKALRNRHNETHRLWGEMVGSGWDSQTAGKLYREIAKLSELGQRRQWYAIEERALDVDVYLSSFIDSKLTPDPTQVEVLQRLLDALDVDLQQTLRSPQRRARSDSSQKPAERIKEVYFLKQTIDGYSDLSRALASHRFGVRPYTDVKTLTKALTKKTPSALLIEMPFVDKLTEIDQLLDTQTLQQGARTAVIVLADEDTMPGRLMALQAGADAFIPPPVVATDLVDRVEKLVSAHNAQPYKVLIVDDDRPQAQFCQAILHRKGIHTMVCQSALSALAEVNTFDPDLVIVDLYMPDMDGFEFTAKLRDQSRHVSIPIIFLSGEKDQQKRFDALALGGSDFLNKPIRPNHLIAAVWSRLRHTRELSQLFPLPPDKSEKTGLYQLESLLKHAQLLMDSAQASRRAFLLYLEPDNIEELNQRYGITSILDIHQYIAGLIDSQFDHKAMLASYNHLSFMAIISDTTKAQATQLAERLVSQTKGRLCQFNSYTLTLPMSAGICRLDQSFGSMDHVAHAAIHACQQAAHEGGSQWHFSAIPNTADAHTKLAQLFEPNFNSDDAQIIYQPLACLHGVDTNPYRVALQLKLAAGETMEVDYTTAATLAPSFQYKLDCWLVQHSFDNITTLGCSVDNFLPRLPISVGSLITDRFNDFLQQTIRRVGAMASQLTLVVDLSQLINKIDQIHDNLIRISQSGMRLCASGVIGTRSQIQYLEHLPITQVELDPQLLAAQDEQNFEESFARLIQTLNDLGLKVTMPGVRNAADMTLLWKLKIDYASGDFIDASILPAQRQRA